MFSAGGRNLPRSLLASGGDSEGFAVPTTLPPNSSRQLRMFSPNKEAELAFRQQLDSISVSSVSVSRKQKDMLDQLMLYLKWYNIEMYLKLSVGHIMYTSNIVKYSYNLK